MVFILRIDLINLFVLCDSNVNSEKLFWSPHAYLINKRLIFNFPCIIFLSYSFPSSNNSQILPYTFSLLASIFVLTRLSYSRYDSVIECLPCTYKALGSIASFPCPMQLTILKQTPSISCHFPLSNLVTPSNYQFF